jgi:hypothetical protein
LISASSLGQEGDGCGNKKVFSRRTGAIQCPSTSHQQLHERPLLENRCPLLEMIPAILTNVGLVEVVLFGAIIYWLFGKSTNRSDIFSNKLNAEIILVVPVSKKIYFNESICLNLYCGRGIILLIYRFVVG